MTRPFSGVFSVLPTPFLPSGAIDWPCMERVIEMFLSAGVDGVTALGVTSEVSRLTDAEGDRVVETVLRCVGGRVPVIVGVTADGTRVAVDRARRASERGASGVMLGGPRMARANADILVDHFATVASEVPLPIIVQDYPVMTGYAIDPSALVRIAREVPAARTIKLEDAPTPPKVALIRRTASDIDIHVLGGLGGVFILEELLAGAQGTMTGFAYPEVIVHIVRAFRAGKVAEAAGIAYRYSALLRFEAQEGVSMAVRKEVLRRRGVLDHATQRAPGGSIDPTSAGGLDSLLDWYGLAANDGKMRWI